MSISHAEYLAMVARTGGTPVPLGDNTERVGDAPVSKEDELHNDIIEYCKNQSPPWLYFHGSMAHGTKRTPGEPDFEILASMGRVFFVECKAKGGKLSNAQRDVKHWAALLGHTVHVVTNMEEFKRIVT